MNVSIFARFPHLIGVGTIVALVCGLYLPFLGNPPIFDDAFLFSGQRFLYYATHPFGLELRVPPLFSFAVVQVLSGHMETHRILSLAFHIACALALYKLLYDLLRAVRRSAAPAATSGDPPPTAACARDRSPALADPPRAA